MILAGVFAGLYAASIRFRVEAHNKRVDLCIDYREVEKLAVWTGKGVPQVLADLKRAGATSVALTEDTVKDLEEKNQLTVDHSESFRQSAIRGTIVESGYVNTIVEALKRLQQIEINPFPTEWIEGSSGTTLVYSGTRRHTKLTYDQLRNLGIGLDPTVTLGLREAGFEVLGRLYNPPTNQAGMTAVLKAAKDQGATTIIFEGLEVMGYRGHAKEAAQAFRDTGILYGSVEMGKQKGDAGLARELDSQYVRVHSVGEAEMGALDASEAIDRFVRAARERNIRICYVRLPYFTGPDPVHENALFLNAIRTGISRGGSMGFGPAKLFEAPNVPTWAFALMALGVVGGMKWLAAKMIPMSPAVFVTKLVLESAICVGAVVALGETGRLLVALLAALIFPTLACIRGSQVVGDGSEPIYETGGAIKAAIGAVIRMSFVTAAGIAMVVGLLTSLTFMVKTEQFMGIKMAHALPILMIAFAMLCGLPGPGQTFKGYLASAREHSAAFFREPVRAGALIASAIGLVALALIVARTGNEPGVGVSGFELKARALMDRALPARPRTKEFLLGHPAMALALAMWFRGRRKWVGPIYLAGVIGQVSMLNTFCHIHTPLYLSAVRDITGLVVGTFFGLAIFWVADRVWCSAERTPVSIPAG
jgi:hypothetical protein